MPLGRKRDRTYRTVLSAAFVVFGAAGVAYMVAPPRTTSDFLDSSIPAMIWGFVFLVGAGIALGGIWKRIPHVERLGLMLVIIAGAVLTVVQSLVMFDPPITWTRAGGTGAYAGFTLIAWALHLKTSTRIEVINLAADIGRRRAEGGGDDGQ